MNKLQYICNNCKITGVKLWRNSYSSTPFLCAVCTIQKESKAGRININVVLDKDGLHFERHTGMTDQIGYMLPAILTEDEMTVYGYTSVPENLVEQWHQLPTYS